MTLWREMGEAQDVTLARIEKRLAESGAPVRRDDGYHDWDLEIEGGVFGGARLRSCVEWPVALLMLIIAAPVILVVAIAARITSPGTAFYTQVRLGRSGRPFKICKIRTMRRDAEKMTGAVWAASANDPRLTPILGKHAPGVTVLFERTLALGDKSLGGSEARVLYLELQDG